MSQYYDILLGVKDVIAAIPGFSGAAFAIRKRPFFSPDHGDTLPFVCASGDRESIAELYMGGQVQDYPVYVTIYQDRGGAIGDLTAEQWQFDRREEVEAALYKPDPLPSVPTCFDCARYDPGPAFDLAGIDSAIDASQQLFVFRNDELAA